MFILNIPGVGMRLMVYGTKRPHGFPLPSVGKKRNLKPSVHKLTKSRLEKLLTCMCTILCITVLPYDLLNGNEHEAGVLIKWLSQIKISENSLFTIRRKAPLKWALARRLLYSICSMESGMVNSLLLDHSLTIYREEKIKVLS